jgi:4-diphosphocytidyl-2-C-methyl-D-erythritol kinase
VLKVRSYAKINFYLDVLDRRDDGYNNIETLFQTVSLFDRLSIERSEKKLHLSCDHIGLAMEPDNLVLRAARALQAHTGTHLGARMHLEKKVPIAAGLAGGSGDAAAALVGLNKVWELGLTADVLATLALGIGSDIPYCLRGGTALATGRGEEISPLGEVSTLWLVLVHPAIPISAAWVYKHPRLGRSAERVVDGRTPRFRAAIAALESGEIAAAVYNGMEAPVFEAHPKMALWKERLLLAGCRAAAMSGSGSTLFGICQDEVHAQAVAAAFRDAPTSIVHTVPRGTEVEM